MGIKNLSKVFKPDEELEFEDIKDEILAIDANNLIYRACLAMQSTHSLTDVDGNPTVHIKTMLLYITLLMSQHNELIFVFDSKPPAEKEAELRRRTEAKYKMAESEALALIDVDKYNKRTFTLPKSFILDIKKMLNYLNIQYIDAPDGFEAEKVCAALTTDDVSVCTAAFSADMDVIPFGATRFYRHVRGSSIHLYTLDNILPQIAAKKKVFVSLGDKVPKRVSASLDDLRRICVILGSDFSPKTPGIGPQTVLAKWDTVDLTALQKKALAYFEIPVPAVEIQRSNHLDTDGLKTWLAQKGFKQELIDKQIQRILGQDSAKKPKKRKSTSSQKPVKPTKPGSSSKSK